MRIVISGAYGRSLPMGYGYGDVAIVDDSNVCNYGYGEGFGAVYCDGSGHGDGFGEVYRICNYGIGTSYGSADLEGSGRSGKNCGDILC